MGELLLIHVVCPNPALDRTIFLNEFKPNNVNRSNLSIDLLGGKGFNVIRSFLIQDQPSFVVHSFLGGYTGDYLRTLISRNGIKNITTQIKGTSRICSIIVDEKLNQAHVINEGGPSIQEEEKQEFTDNLLNKVKPDDFVIFSGSLPQGLEEDFYYSLISQLQHVGAKCILDSSGNYLDEGVKANPWLVKVNEQEFFELIGKSEDAIINSNLADELKNIELSSHVVVTLGSEGCIAKLDNTLYQVSLPKIKAKNPTASGDIFLGALIKAIANGESPVKALRMASTYSLSNCLYWYPNIAISDVESYKNHIKIFTIGG